jgi:hypothetical protein
MTLGGTPASALLQPVSINLGWTGQLAVGRGGTGASTLTGVLIGNGTSAVTAVTGTAGQILRRNTGNTAYEFWSANYLVNPMTLEGSIIYSTTGGTPAELFANSTSTRKYLSQINGTAPSWEALPASVGGSGTTNYVAKWTSSTTLGNSVIYDDGSQVGIGTAPTANFHVIGSTAIAESGVSQDTGGYATFGVTRAATASNLAYIGLTKAGTIPYGIGVGSNNNFIIGVVTASTQVINSPLLSIDYTNGNLGIGTNSPTQKLSVEGSISLNYLNASANYYFYLNRKTGQDGGILYQRDNANDWQQNVDSNGNLYYYSYGTSANAITLQRSTGYLGIGVATPVSHLDVFGSINLRSTYNLTWGGAYGADIPTISGTSGSSNGFLQFYPAGSTSGVKMALVRTGQLKLPSYTSSSAFTGTSVATLAVDAAGDVITIAPQQTTASGTYTPTWSGLANVDSVTAFSCQYMRFGDTVTVSGWVTINATADNTPTSLSFSLPINSATSSVNYLNGTGVAQGGGPAASLSGYASNFGEFEVIPAVDTDVNYSFIFTYRIV